MIVLSDCAHLFAPLRRPRELERGAGPAEASNGGDEPVRTFVLGGFGA
jgi:hypothetical protein